MNRNRLTVRLAAALGPGQAAAMRRIRAALDPAGILNPRCLASY